MAEIPAEAVRAAAAAVERELMSRPFDPFFKGDEALARVAVEAAAPFLAEHIAGLIRERGLEAALDCWCHDTYADLAREAFPKETDQ